MATNPKRNLPELCKVITCCGRNIWAYPALSDPDFLHRVGLREAIRDTASTLPKGVVVADLGCGWMPYKQWFTGEDRTYIPLDVTGYPDHRFRIIRHGKIPLPNASVDALICWQVLEHVHHLESFFDEVKRVLKSGAHAFFTTHGLFRIHDREDFWRWTPAGLQMLFAEQGFDGFTIRPCDSTFAITTSLLNQAWRPQGHAVPARVIQWLVSVCVNIFGLSAEHLSDGLGLAGHRIEATTYLVKVSLKENTAQETQRSINYFETPSHRVRTCVAVCTRNRVDDLERLFPALEALNYPPELVEFIIVDNSSTDSTPEIARSWCARQRNAKYLREDRPGLPFARNLAWRATSAELVVYLDDDAIPEPAWLNQLAAGYDQAHHEDISRHIAVGGRVTLQLPELPGDSHLWLGSSLMGWLSELDYGPDTFILDKPLMHLMGANFAVPRRTLEQIGGFAEQMPGYGGDERYIENAIRAGGGELLYVGSATVRHQISPGKLTPQWFRHRLLVEGRAVAHLQMHHLPRKPGTVIRRALSSLRDLFHGLFGLARNKLEPRPTYFSQSCRLWFGWGSLSETLRLVFRGGS
jgi:glycosyltransferase involved in cell wall biosynthesis